MLKQDEWGSEAFGSLCERGTVGVVVRPRGHYVPQGIPALRTLNVKPGQLDLSDLVYFSREANDGALAKSKLISGDLVIARTGNTGTTAIVPQDLDGANAIDLIIATPDRKKASPEFLAALLNSDLGKHLVAGESRGQVQQHFNVGSLKKAAVPFPPLRIQHEFALRLRNIAAQRHKSEIAATQKASLFASLQSRAFRGEL